MVDDQIDRDERLDTLASRPIFSTADRIAARSTSSGTPVKSCKITRATTNGISSVPLGLRLPRGKLPDALLAYAFAAVEISQHGFEHYAYRDWQPRDISKTCFFQLLKGIKKAFFPISGSKGLPRIE